MPSQIDSFAKNQECILVRDEQNWQTKLTPSPPFFFFYLVNRDLQTTFTMCQKGMGAFGSIIDLFAAEAASGMAWFLYFYLNCHNWNTFTLHFDSNFNQDQLHLHLTPASSWATVRASSSSNSLIPSLWK